MIYIYHLVLTRDANSAWYETKHLSKCLDTWPCWWSGWFGHEINMRVIFTTWYFIATRLVRTRENDKSYKVLNRLSCWILWRFLFVLSLLFCFLVTAVTLVDPRPGFYLAQDQWWTDRLQRDRWADVASQQYVHFVLYFSWNELFKFFFLLIFWNCVWASHLLWELENIQILYRTDPGTRILLFAFGLWDIHSTILH